MQRLLIDTNCLRAPDLDTYLSGSQGNKIVIMDLQSMEMHKSDAIISAKRSTAITCRYPRQVLLLRPTRDFYTWRLNSRAKVSRLISERETRGFAAYGVALQRDPPTPELLARIAQNETAHGAHWDRLKADSSHIPQTFKKYVGQLTSEERRLLQRRTPFSAALQHKLLSLATEVAMDLYYVVDDLKSHRPGQKVYLRDTFVFRYALCLMLLYTRWVYFGQNMVRSIDQVTNDVVDMHLAALGSFFDGVLSKDRNLMSVHQELRYIVRASGAFIG